MGKTYKVEAPVENFTGPRNIPTGVVVFQNGVAECSRKEAEELVKKGYFCKELDVTRPEPEPDVADKIASLEEENQKLTETIGTLQQNIAKLTEANGKLKAENETLKKKGGKS